MMKLCLFFFLFSFSIFAQTTPVSEFEWTTAWDFQSTVIESNEPVIVVFTKAQCLEMTSSPSRNCLLGEKMIGKTLPRIAPGLKVVFIDMFREGPYLSQVSVQSFSTLILYIDGQALERHENLSDYALFQDFMALQARVNRLGTY
jgi:hypothetical protein